MTFSFDIKNKTLFWYERSVTCEHINNLKIGSLGNLFVRSSTNSTQCDHNIFSSCTKLYYNQSNINNNYGPPVLN